MLPLYMDHHVHIGITRELRARGVDVLTAYEDNHHEADDTTLLDRAQTLGRILFSQDEDLLREAAFRQRAGIPFAGVIYAHQNVRIGPIIDDLEMVVQAGRAEDALNDVIYVPL
jgi:predicted nuclease of predicted toxin-antitoxin system